MRMTRNSSVPVPIIERQYYTLFSTLLQQQIAVSKRTTSEVFNEPRKLSFCWRFLYAF
jgi:hypothetical protein